jgi:hypothetical protein
MIKIAHGHGLIYSFAIRWNFEMNERKAEVQAALPRISSVS